MRSLHAALALAALFAGSACGAAAGPACGAGAACEAGVCVVGRCRVPDAPPAERVEARRFVLEPIDAAVISSRGGDDAARPEAFALGRAGAGTVELLVRFEVPWRDDAEVASAFLVLEAVEGAPPAATPVRASFARVLESWSSDSVTWGRQPRLGPLDSVDLPPATSKTKARVDVTSLVRGWGRSARRDHGVALVAEGRDAFGGLYAFGFGATPGPRLEAYVRPFDDAPAARTPAPSADPAPAKEPPPTKTPAPVPVSKLKGQVAPP